LATFEARRLIDAHGVEVIDAILDQATANGRTKGRDIIAAVAKVTGEDMQVRFRLYQDFDTREEGMALYAPLFNKASEEKRWEDATIISKRIMELRQEFDPKFYGNVALLLHRAGFVADADQVLLKQIKNFANPKANLNLQLHWIIYALKTDQCPKAYDATEAVLDAEANLLPALAVRLHRQESRYQSAEARATAEQILKIQPDANHLAHKFAASIIAKLDAQVGPKHQPAGSQPAGKGGEPVY
jgi:hypothetical protein